MTYRTWDASRGFTWTFVTIVTGLFAAGWVLVVPRAPAGVVALFAVASCVWALWMIALVTGTVSRIELTGTGLRWTKPTRTRSVSLTMVDSVCCRRSGRGRRWNVTIRLVGEPPIRFSAGPDILPFIEALRSAAPRVPISLPSTRQQSHPTSGRGGRVR